MQIRIPATASISSCEQALRQLAKVQFGPCHLVMPTNFKHTSFGAEISWVQFLLTWAKKYKSCRLSTFAEEPKDLQIEKFTKQLIGIVASLCASEVRSHTNNSLLTDYYKGLAIDRLDKLQERRPNDYTKGQKIDVIANDDLGRCTPKSLYPRQIDGHRELGERPYYVLAAPRLIKAILPLEKGVTTDPDTDKAVGNLLYETFKNTEDHAKRDIMGNSFQHSYRIMQASFTTGIKENLIEATQGVDPLQQYISKFRATNGKLQLTFLSLSVLDSGPGFAQTLTMTPLKKLGFSEELSATLRCFTAATRRNRPEYGKGLELVRAYLRKRRGFLRLRTGRVSLYYDGDLDTNLNEPIPLKLWAVAEHPLATPVEGSLISMHIPVGDTH